MIELNYTVYMLNEDSFHREEQARLLPLIKKHEIEVKQLSQDINLIRFNLFAFSVKPIEGGVSKVWTFTPNPPLKK